MVGGGARRGTLVHHYGTGHQRPLLDRGSPETEPGPAVANPRIRVCSTVVFSAAPCHARPATKCLLPSRSGDEHPCLTPWKRDMRVVQRRQMVPLLWPAPEHSSELPVVHRTAPPCQLRRRWVVPDPTALLGTWRMVSWVREVVATGERADVLGPDPVGYIAYHGGGRMMALVVRN